MRTPMPLAATDVALAQRERPATGDGDGEAAALAKQFETLLLGELVKAMRASSAIGGEGDDAFAKGTYQEMFDQSLVDAAAGGLGLQDALVRQLAGTPGDGGDTLLSGSRPLASALPPRPSAPAIAGAPSLPRGRAAPAWDDSLGTTFDGGVPTPGVFPVDGGVPSSGYGWRTHPIHGDRRFHAGLDIAAPQGREIRAVQRGEVITAERHKGYGNMVEIRHPDGVVTRYAHASKLYVREGDLVDVGETIADVGSTGQSTGPHLHFEARRDGHAIDPQRYLERLRSDGDAQGEARRSRTGIAALRSHAAAVGPSRDDDGLGTTDE
ncbi:MAG: peptidoglycan DD-metalloendopeptidase family protein [Nannocystaceae bacterium]|nr:peptidoglycan DD-metalloendopeptidase family protein [Nannocystaceae bacterium]